MPGTFSDGVIGSLVESAADFVERAVSEVESAPKYAVIHFSTGVELFLKARLAMEHWTLVFADPGRASRESLRSGDFQSVSSKKAMDRLGGVLERPFSPSARKAFDALSARRNRYVHFVDPARAFRTGPEGDTTERVASEQLRAWYELHLLIGESWADEFRPFSGTVERLDRRMHGHRRFLDHKAARLATELDAIRSGGKTVDECPACGHEAVVGVAEYGDLELARCRVCGQDGRWLWVEVGDDPPIRIGEEGVPLDVEREALDVVDLIETYAPFQRPEDELVDPIAAYCGACERSDIPTVIPWEAGHQDDSWEPEHRRPAPPLYLCMSCLDAPDAPRRCEWCGERVTGEVGDYYTPGCSMCAYHIEREAR